MLVLTKIT